MSVKTLQDNKSLAFASHGYVLVFHKPSESVAAVYIDTGVYKIESECTKFQLSFHWDELSESYYIRFGNQTTVSNLLLSQVNQITEFYQLSPCLSLVGA